MNDEQKASHEYARDVQPRDQRQTAGKAFLAGVKWARENPPRCPDYEHDPSHSIICKGVP